MNYDPRKLGYYRVGEFETFRKFEAIMENRKTQAGVQWIFNDQEFAQHDWHRHSGTSLPDLYLRRAQQLRDRYDYLVLFYSGGSDSQTILDTCLKHNIHIDEIATCWSLKGAKSPEAYFNAEIHHVASPYLESIKHRIPHTKLRLIDQTDMILAEFTHDHWYVDHANHLTPNCVTRSKFRELIPEYRELVDSGRTVGFIWGRDKPKLRSDDQGNHWIQFDDYMDNNTSAYSQARSHLGWYDEFFYHDPDSAEIIINQCHTVLGRLEERSIDTRFFVDHVTACGRCPHTGRYLNMEGLNHVIYPDWDTHTFSNGKNVSVCWGERDDWFFQRCMHTPSYQHWLNGINIIYREYYHQDSNQSWLNGDSVYENIKGVLGPRFYLNTDRT